MSILIFILILAILILVHEFGHFIVAKKSGIRVDEFGLGFPPKIFAKKWGDTLYTLNAIPFGGFVKIFGEDSHNETVNEEDKKESFHYKPKWIQASVLVAGVTFNIIFAWLLISLGFMIGMPSGTGYSGFGEVGNAELVVTKVISNSPAEKAGIISGDVIKSISAGKTSLSGEDLTPESLQRLVTESDSKSIEISIARGKNLPDTLFIEPDATNVAGRRVIGIGTESMGILKLPIHLALLEGARTTALLLKATAIGLFDFFWNVVTFRSDFSQVAGPIGIASVVSEASELGFIYLLSLTALISINLALINLLPFPALDGGRLFFLLIESIIRRPISPKFVQKANFVGFALLIVLMLVVTAHDIFRLF